MKPEEPEAAEEDTREEDGEDEPEEAGEEVSANTFEEDLVRVLLADDLQAGGKKDASRTHLRVLLVIMTFASVIGIIAYAIIKKPWMLIVMIALIAAYVVCCIAVAQNGKKKNE